MHVSPKHPVARLVQQEALAHLTFNKWVVPPSAADAPFCSTSLVQNLLQTSQVKFVRVRNNTWLAYARQARAKNAHFMEAAIRNNMHMMPSIRGTVVVFKLQEGMTTEIDDMWTDVEVWLRKHK